jgi:hypothetical protein
MAGATILSKRLQPPEQNGGRSRRSSAMLLLVICLSVGGAAIISIELFVLTRFSKTALAPVAKGDPKPSPPAIFEDVLGERDLTALPLAVEQFVAAEPRVRASVAIMEAESAAASGERSPAAAAAASASPLANGVSDERRLSATSTTEAPTSMTTNGALPRTGDRTSQVRVDVPETSAPNGAPALDKRPPNSASASKGENDEKIAPFQPITASRAPATDTQALVVRGDTLFATGDITSARLFYERATDAGDGQAALRLGESYDPAFLQRAHLRAVRGDPAVAVKWYKRARELGASEADILLMSIEAK